MTATGDASVDATVPASTARFISGSAPATSEQFRATGGPPSWNDIAKINTVVEMKLDTSKLEELLAKTAKNFGKSIQARVDEATLFPSRAFGNAFHVDVKP